MSRVDLSSDDLIVSAFALKEKVGAESISTNEERYAQAVCLLEDLINLLMTSKSSAAVAGSYTFGLSFDDNGYLADACKVQDNTRTGFEGQNGVCDGEDRDYGFLRSIFLTKDTPHSCQQAEAQSSGTGQSGTIADRDGFLKPNGAAAAVGGGSAFNLTTKPCAAGGPSLDEIAAATPAQTNSSGGQTEAFEDGAPWSLGLKGKTRLSRKTFPAYSTYEKKPVCHAGDESLVDLGERSSGLDRPTEDSCEGTARRFFRAFTRQHVRDKNNLDRPVNELE